MKLGARGRSNSAKQPQLPQTVTGGFADQSLPTDIDFSQGYNQQTVYRPKVAPSPQAQVYPNASMNQSMEFQSPFMPNPNPQPMFGTGVNANSAPFGTPNAPNQPQLLNPIDLMNNPAVTQFAMQYGSDLANSGQQLWNKKVERFLSITNMKHYFAVDTNYVVKKLKIITFPFLHQEWQVNYNQNEPVAPQFDVNVPDLYIPSMAFVTYILLAGVCLGIENKFSPEHLGIIGSSAFAWYLLELFVIYALTFILNINTSFRSFIDVFSFCGYKFYLMLILLLCSIVGGSFGYYMSWIYTSIASSYFLIKTIRLCILSNVSHDSYVQQGGGQKRKWYFVLYFAVTQPLLAFWLTKHVALS